MTLSLMNYVQWLHTVENMKLEIAKERAREVFSKQTGQLIPLDYVVTPEEFKDLEQAKKLRNLH